MFFKKKILFSISFFLLSILILANPNTPVIGTGKIDVEVVKPIEILLHSNIYHSVFKGVSQKILGNFFLEIKTSPNALLLVQYDKQILLSNKDNNSIPLILKDIVNSISSDNTSDKKAVIIKNSANTLKQKWYIPYEIILNGNENIGIYDGIISITIQYS